MKRLIAGILTFVSLVTISAPAFATGVPEQAENINMASYIASEEEIEAGHRAQLLEHLEELGIDPEECIFPNETNEIRPLSDEDNYKIEYWPTVEREYFGEPDGIPEGGMQFPTGGGFWVALTGGREYSFSITFDVAIPKFSFPFTLSFGTVTSGGAAGIYVEAPNTVNYYKCIIGKTVQFRPYTIYIKTWDEVSWSYTWEEYSNSATKQVIQGRGWAQLA